MLPKSSETAEFSENGRRQVELHFLNVRVLPKSSETAEFSENEWDAKTEFKSNKIQLKYI